MPPRFHLQPWPNVAVRDWHPGRIALGVGGDMVTLPPEACRDVALALMEAAQLIEGGDTYANAVARAFPKGPTC